jgi:hypothetical protein
VPTDPTIDIGTKVVGFSAASGLKGKVVNSRESGFGVKWVEVEKKDGTTEWARTIYLSKKGKS